MSGAAASEAAVGYAKEQGTRFVEELKDLLRIPSVSTAPEHAGDVRRAAEFVADGLRAAGMENVRLIETSTARSGRASAGLCGLAEGAREAYGAALWAL